MLQDKLIFIRECNHNPNTGISIVRLFHTAKLLPVQRDPIVCNVDSNFLQSFKKYKYIVDLEFSMWHYIVDFGKGEP